MRLLLLLLAAAPAAAPAAAQRPADVRPADGRSDSLATVTVTAARVALAVHDAPVHTAVVGREALADAAVRSVADALDARTPAVVRRYGAGGLASVSVRGAGAAQTLVLLDGLPLVDPQLGQLDLSLLPASLLESVEVTGGAASGLFGSGALGGVVALTSGAAPGARMPGVRAAAEAGAWGERRLTARVGVRLERTRLGALSATVAGEAAQTDGDYAVPDPTRLGSPLVRRAGWDGRQASAVGTLRVDGAAGHAGLSLWLADAERGLGGTAVPQAGADASAVVGARQWDRLARLATTASRRTPWGHVDAALAATRTRLRYASPFPATRAGALDETGRTLALALDVSATANRIAPGWTATALAAASEGRAEHPSLAGYRSGGARDRAAGAGVSAVGRVGRVALFPALRADVYAPERAVRRAALSPQLGVAVAASRAVTVRASAGRAFRMPTLNDRFWTPGGNPGLRPESGVTADAGVAWQARGAQAELTAFASRTRDLIVWQPGSGTGSGVWSPENVARARTRGAEATAGAARLLGRTLLDGGMAATLLDARDADTGFRLRYSPRWTARLWAGVARGALRADVGVRAVGSRPTTASGSLPLPAHAVVGAQLRASRGVGAGVLALGLALDNLLDARYESVRSYPMPPRNARLRLTLDLR